ncbi:MAG: monomethylamine:corrinoid methyltransferase, partial [Methanomassiliicoccaceae archaeon]|nr:monomethylamine:corrinoid methyltransferase [Methanomassiliicoccaceae archaeon]
MAAAGPISVFEAYDRFQNGRKVREDTWNHTIVPNNAAALKDKYRLNFGKSIIPEDRDICDRLFEAGVEMLVMTGFFNPDISKVMNVTESEVFEGLKKATPRLRLGSGRDEVICARRRGNSSIRPIIQGGPTGTQVSEDMIVTMMQAYAQEALVDSLAG